MGEMFQVVFGIVSLVILLVNIGFCIFDHG